MPEDTVRNCTTMMVKGSDFGLVHTVTYRCEDFANLLCITMNNGSSTLPSMPIQFEVQESARDNRFVSIPFLWQAGIGKTNESKCFFCRASVAPYLAFIVDRVQRNLLGLIDGLPGTGKSSLLWYKVLCLAKHHGKTFVWFHFDRHGFLETYVKVDSNGLLEFDPGDFEAESLEWIEDVDGDIMVMNGVNQKTFVTLLGRLRRWRKKGKNIGKHRSGFLSMSNKIERLHAHELDAMREPGLYAYFTLHSWTLDEFIEGFLNEDGSRSPLFEENVELFKKEWEIAEGNDRKRDSDGMRKVLSIEEIISQKYFVTGGSARWMLSKTRAEAEAAIRESIGYASNIPAILEFQVGPQSSMAKTHLYFSSETTDGLMTFSIVSERATHILAEMGGQAAIKALYGHARIANNPAFLGWIVEADFFDRCKRNTLTLREKGAEAATRMPCPNKPLEFDCDELQRLSNLKDKSRLQRAIRNLLPSLETSPSVCKPMAWNQGGYDVIRILKGPVVPTEETSEVKESYHLLYGQVTKSDTHSLKLKFFEQFAGFVAAAGYIVSSIEIGFIVPSGQVDVFRITPGKVDYSGRLIQHEVYGSLGQKWEKRKEHTFVKVYELDVSEMNYPVGV